MEKYFPMHEGVDMGEEKGQLEQMAEAGLLEESSEVFSQPEDPQPEAPFKGRLALLHAKHEVDYDRWAAYLKAIGYTVRTTKETTTREILADVAVADVIVVTHDWYIDSWSNVLLLLGRLVEADLYSVWDQPVAGSPDTTLALVPIPGASLNPVEMGRLLRNEL